MDKKEALQIALRETKLNLISKLKFRASFNFGKALYTRIDEEIKTLEQAIKILEAEIG